MATHGFFGEALNERDNPMFRSGLNLADIEQVEVDRERDDGQLTAYEVSGMDLRGTQLVVLSACETGMGAAVMAEGKELMSEGVSGLRRAFAMAGARTTVMLLKNPCGGWSMLLNNAPRGWSMVVKNPPARVGHGREKTRLQVGHDRDH